MILPETGFKEACMEAARKWGQSMTLISLATGFGMQRRLEQQIKSTKGRPVQGMPVP